MGHGKLQIGIGAQIFQMAAECSAKATMTAMTALSVGAEVG
jgi:hypothetical protein